MLVDLISPGGLIICGWCQCAEYAELLETAHYRALCGEAPHESEHVMRAQVSAAAVPSV